MYVYVKVCKHYLYINAVAKNKRFMLDITTGCLRYI